MSLDEKQWLASEINSAIVEHANEDDDMATQHDDHDFVSYID